MARKSGVLEATTTRYIAKPDELMAGTEQTQARSRLSRFGEAFGVALIAALVCALPSGFRSSSAGGSWLDGWLAATAVLFGLVVWPALLWPKAARGFRGVVSDPARRRILLGVALWVALSVLALTLLGTLLKATTNHRGLGGATFGVFGAAAVVGAAIAAGRLLAFGRWLQEREVPRMAIAVGFGVLLSLPLATVGLPLTGGEESPTRAAVFDLLLMVAVMAGLCWRRLPEAINRVTRVLALPAALAILVIGIVRVETSHAEPMKQKGGVAGAVLQTLELWTDTDGDGMGAHFGGADCDEGDQRRRPGLADEETDGIDRDCDGVDGPLRLVAEPLPQNTTTPATVVAAAPPSDAATTPATATATATAAPAAVPNVAQPDLILVTLDTVRADLTTPYGSERDTTPALAALAKRGVLFEHAYAIGSTTQRALAPIVTGKPLSAIKRSADDWPTIHDDNDTLAEQLSEAGYATGAVVSFTWLRPERGFAQGFNYFEDKPWQTRHPEREYTGDVALSAAKNVYDKLAKSDKPLFLWVHLFDAHKRYVDHADIDYGDGQRDRYLAEVTFVDRQLGGLVEHVDAGPRADKTVYLVHGSHGEAFNEHDVIEHGREVYNETIWVPLVVAGAGVKPRKVARAVSTLDIAPTLLSLANAPLNDSYGVSLRDALGGSELARDPVLSYARHRVAVVDWPFKLVARTRKGSDARLLLFDLSADPGETKDVAGDHNDVLRRLDDVRQRGVQDGDD